MPTLPKVGRIPLLNFCLATFGKSRVTVVGNSFHLRGSCLKIVPALTEEFGQFASCWINDPPYGTTLNEWDTVIPSRDYWKMASSVTLPTSPLVVFGSQPFTSAMVMSAPNWHRYCLVWDKNKCGSPGLAKYRPMKTHEDIIVFSRKTPSPYYPQMEEGVPYHRAPSTVNSRDDRVNNHKYGFKIGQGIDNKGTRYPTSIRRVSRDFSAQQQIHPTQKPVPLISWLLATYSRPRDIVIDVTSGSSSLSIAALQRRQPAILIERDPTYYAAGVAWAKAICEGRAWDPARYRKHHIEPALKEREQNERRKP